MTYYVSPTGGDGNPGTPGLPLQTLAAAVDRSRSGNGEKEIVLLAGEYENTRVALDSRDSGLTIRGEGGPVLRGGIRLYGWEPCAGDGGLYSLALPAGFAGSIRMLEINGRLRQRSRYPREGFLLHNSAFASNWISTSGGGWDVKPTEDELRRLEYDPEVLPAGFDWDGAELTVFHKWDETLAGVSAHDPEKRLLTLSVPCTHPPGAFGVKKFVVWNTRFGMEPGCWRLGTGGKLLYRPFPGEDMRGAAAYIPLFESVITIEGDVAGLTIRDVAFMTTASPERPAGFGAAKTTGAADSAARLEDCVFSGLSFRNAGGWGLRLHGENKNVAVRGCRTADTGGGGIMLRKGTKCAITGCTVERAGLIHPSAIGIEAQGCEVANNVLRDLPYSGICYGGGDGGVIRDNFISNAVGVLNDGGGIYATFCNNGVIRGNHVENIRQKDEPDSTRNGLYIDEQSRGWLVEGNVTVNCTSAMMNHMSGSNTLRNNVFAVPEGDLLVSFIRCEDYRLEANAFQAGGKVTLAGKKGVIAAYERNWTYSGAGRAEQVLVEEDYSRSEARGLGPDRPLA